MSEDTEASKCEKCLEKNNAIAGMASEYSSLEYCILSLESKIREMKNISTYDQTIVFLTRQEQMMDKKIFEKQDDLVRKEFDKFRQEIKTEYDKLLTEYTEKRERLIKYSKEISSLESSIETLRKKVCKYEILTTQYERENEILKRKLDWKVRCKRYSYVNRNVHNPR